MKMKKILWINVSLGMTLVLMKTEMFMRNKLILPRI